MPGLKKGIKQIKMQKGGNFTDFQKAFAKARRDFINKKIDPKTGKPAKATFMFQGKRFNVQTKEDRKTILNKLGSPVARKDSRAKNGGSKVKTTTNTATATSKNKLGPKPKPKVVGTELDDPRLARFKDKTAIKKSQEQIAAGVKKAEERRKKEKIKGEFSSIPLALLPTGRISKAIKGVTTALGGAKGIKQAATRARGQIKKELQGRKIGAGKDSNVDLVKGVVQQFTKKQPAITKRQATLAAKKNKKAELAAKRKKEQSVNTKVKRLSRGARSKQFVNRASGGVFKGTF